MSANRVAYLTTTLKELTEQSENHKNEIIEKLEKPDLEVLNQKTRNEIKKTKSRRHR